MCLFHRLFDAVWFIHNRVVSLVPVIPGIIMRRASEASLFFLGFPRKKKPLHNGSYEHRVCGVGWYVWRPGGGVDGEKHAA